MTAIKKKYIFTIFKLVIVRVSFLLVFIFLSSSLF